MKDDLRRLAKLFKAEALAEARIAEFDARLDEARRALPHRPEVTWINVHDRTISFASREHLTCKLIDAFARCVAPASPAGQTWVSGSAETIAELDPEVIIASNWSGLEAEKYLARLGEDPIWQTLSAYRNGRIYTYDDYPDLSVRGLPTAMRLIDVVLPILQRLPRPDVAH